MYNLYKNNHYKSFVWKQKNETKKWKHSNSIYNNVFDWHISIAILILGSGRMAGMWII